MADVQAAPTSETARSIGQSQEEGSKMPISIPFRDNVTLLLKKMRTLTGRSGGPFAIVISFESLAHVQRLSSVVAGFYDCREKLCELAGGALIQIGDIDFVLLSDRSEYGVVGAVADIKMVLLKVMADNAPDAFAGLDQAQLVRVLDLSRQRRHLLELVERTLRRTTAEPSSRSARAMSPADIHLLLEKIDALSRPDFVDRFTQFQAIATFENQQQPVVALKERFVSISALQRTFLPSTNLQLNQPLFKLLTLELDQRMLDCLLRKHIEPGFATFNLNVETIFTSRFEQLGTSGIARNLVVEVRASDAFEDYDRFLLARKYVAGFGGRIAIDGVRPSMLSLVKPDHRCCDLIKVFVDDYETASPDFAEAVREIQGSGTQVAFARIESAESVRAAIALGVDLFQGFYIDTLMKGGEERDRFLVG